MYEFQSFAGVSLLAIILAPITIIIISRAITVYGGCAILRFAKIRIPLQWQNILTLGGLRGGIAVAMVLSLPMDYEFKNLFIAAVISVVVINLVGTAHPFGFLPNEIKNCKCKCKLKH